MNKRIRELALQAGHKPLGTFADELMDIYNKKFAELIVKECAELCLKHETMIGPFNTTEFRKGRHFNTMIKQHFGVEE